MASAVCRTGRNGKKSDELAKSLAPRLAGVNSLQARSQNCSRPLCHDLEYSDDDAPTFHRLLGQAIKNFRSQAKTVNSEGSRAVVSDSGGGWQ